MKITLPKGRNPVTELGDVAYGSLFEYDGRYYLLTSELSKSGNLLAVRIKAGTTRKFSVKLKVTVFPNAKIHPGAPA